MNGAFHMKNNKRIIISSIEYGKYMMNGETSWLLGSYCDEFMLV